MWELAFGPQRKLKLTWAGAGKAISFNVNFLRTKMRIWEIVK